MADSAMWALGENFALEANAPAPGWGTMVGRNVYTCSDGRQVTVAATEPRSWAALTAALESRNWWSCASAWAPTLPYSPGWRTSSRPNRRRTGAKTLATQAESDR